MPADKILTTRITKNGVAKFVNNADVAAAVSDGWAVAPQTFDFSAAAVAAANTAYNAAIAAGRSVVDASRAARAALLVYEGQAGLAVTNGVSFVTAPTTAADSGMPGQIAFDTGYIYVCVATDTWLRAAIATWP